ncbi:MAG TPA: Zn-binding domain-containing protein, partial [Thermoanaerobaculia bacterium]
LAAADGDEIFSLRRRPQRHVNLRGSGETFAILAGGRTIGTVDGVRVLHECHPGAVYLHAGRQFLVTALEREERRVQAEAADLDYFTTPLTEKETEILEVLEEKSVGPLQAWLGRLKVTERVVGFERKRIHGQEVIDQTPLDLPPVEFETVGLWWAAPQAIEETLRRQGEHFLGSLHASEHTGISLFPILALCDRGDIGGISYPLHPQMGTGAVFIYDGHPGGVGIAARGFEDLTDLLGRILLLLEGCPCEKGCPSCVQSPKCGNGNRPLDKPGAARTLRLLLGQEEPAVPWGEAVRVTLMVAEAVEEEVGDRGSSLQPPAERVVGATRGRPSATVEESPSQRHAHLRISPAAPVEPIRAEPLLLQRPSFPSDRGERAAWGGPGSAARVRTGEPPCTVLFDLETLRSAADVGGWHKAHRMGVAVGVACFLEEGRIEVYPEGQVGALMDALRRASLVIGYNIKRFDYLVLAGYSGEDFARTLPTLDLLEDVACRLGFRVGMGHLALETLGVGKSADGLQSLEWVRQGRLDLVEQYCRKDVEILRDLYLHGRREGFLFYRDKQRDQKLKLGVEW